MLLPTTTNAVAPWEGQLVWMGDFNEGVSQNGNAYAFASFTLKYQDSQMQERFITFQVSGVEKVQNLKSYPIGVFFRVSWMPSSRKYVNQQNEEKWFPSFVAYNVQAIQPAGGQQPVQQPMQQQGWQQMGQTPANPQYTQSVQTAYQQPVQQPAYQQPARPQQATVAPAAPTAPAQMPLPSPTDDLPF